MHIQAHSISGMYPRMHIYYLISIISLVCSNLSEILELPVPVQVDAHIVYFNMY